MTDPKTLGVYAEQAATYAKVTQGLARDPLLQAFIAAVKPGGTVLDLGCGPGIAADQMALAGLIVTAMDPVAEMVALAGQKPGVTAIQGTFEDLTAIDAFDGVWANFSLLHAPRADIPRHLASIARALRKGGIFHIAVKSGTGSKRDALGRFYTYFTEAELSKLLTDAGFVITDRANGCDKGLDGAMADWICLRAWRS